MPDGLHLLDKNGWNYRHFEEPALTEVSFSVDVYRAIYNVDERTLYFDIATAENKAEDLRQSAVCLAVAAGAYCETDWR